MISSSAAMDAAKSLADLNFFPSEENGQISVATIISSMCHTVDQARWLVEKMHRTYNSWPGPLEMRACFCSKFRPIDGFEVGSTIYPDGIPSDKEQLPQIVAPDVPALEGSESAEFLRIAVRALRPPIHVQTEPAPKPKPKTKPIDIIPEGTHPAQTPCGCFGTGRLARDRYCTCQMGMDLYRIENKDRLEFDKKQNEIRQTLQGMGL